MRRMALLCGLSLVGCFEAMNEDLSQTAKRRGALEIDCPFEQVEVVRRAGLGPDTYEVRGCGKRTLYSCTKHQANRWAQVRPTCVPEESATVTSLD